MEDKVHYCINCKYCKYKKGKRSVNYSEKNKRNKSSAPKEYSSPCEEQSWK